VKTFS